MRHVFPPSAIVFLFVLFLPCWTPAAEPPLPQRHSGPWDMESLHKVPAAEFGQKSGLLQEVYYAGEPYNGKPTRVFAYYARPKEGDGPFPGMLLVHGGGGKAFSEWATLWAERGYCALSMDLAGHGPDGKRVPDGGPDQGDGEKFRPFGDGDAKEMWTYHAVAAVIRGHSLLASRTEVDGSKIGVTGISWGGYLTCIVAGLDDRLKVAVPVYGCGFLDQNSAWLPTFGKMQADQRQRWVKNFDPSQYLPGADCPMLFVNGTNDFAYPLDSYQASYRLVAPAPKLCVTVRMPHSHPEGWKPKEIGLFVDSVLLDKDPLADVGLLKIDGATARATFTSKVPIATAQLHFTADAGPWQKRNWTSVDAKHDKENIWAELPAQRPLVCFMTVRDNRGALVSTPHVELARSAK